MSAVAAMRISLVTVVALGALACSPSFGEAQSMGETLFPAQIESAIGDHTVKLVRTGSGLRKKGDFRVYAVASYLEDGVKVQSARELAEIDRAKQLHLVFMLRVSGDDLTQAFRKIFRENHPEPAFSDELKALLNLFQKGGARNGDHVWITHIPTVGLQCRCGKQEEILIKNVDFSRAVWDNYFGKSNAGEEVKRALFAGQ